jgi:hypothetical protein
MSSAPKHRKLNFKNDFIRDYDINPELANGQIKKHELWYKTGILERHFLIR